MQAAEQTEENEKPDNALEQMPHIQEELGETKEPADSDVLEEEVPGEMEEMQERLRCKEKEFEEFRQSVENMIEEKGKEMSALIMSLGEIEDSQMQRQKEMSKIDAEMKMLNLRKTEIALESETADKEMKRLEKKKLKLELFQQSFTTETNSRLQKLQTEIYSLQQGMVTGNPDSLQRGILTGNPERSSTEQPAPPPDAGTRASPSFLTFLERQIEDVERELECPVCFEIASEAPIFRCEEDHLICSKCREKVSSCPVCRVEYPEGAGKRLRGAERQAERLAAMYKERESLLQNQ